MSKGHSASLARCFSLGEYGQIASRSGRSDMADSYAELDAYCVYWWHYIMRPLNIGLIGLAFAVALWGFAYKLSLYQFRQNPSSQISVMKMWLGPEGPSAAVRNRANSNSHSKSTLEPFSTCKARSSPASRNGTQTAPEVAFATRCRSTICTPRSPPSQDSMPNPTVAA